MRIGSQLQSSERGVALVMAMLVLLLVSFLAVVMMSSLNVETKLTGYTLKETEALNNAEAGVAEAIARIRVGDVVDDLNPRKVTQIFLQPTGSVPTLGTDSLALATGQPAGAYLAYSKAAKGPGVLTIKYKTNAARTVIYRYDKTKVPPENTLTGEPIFTIESTGTSGNAEKHVYVEVIKQNIDVIQKGAVVAAMDIKLNGNGNICGYNHDFNSPEGAGSGGISTCNAYHLGSGDLPGVWSTVSESGGGASTQEGVPSGILSNQVGFYSGPWDALGMSQSEFYQMVGSPVNTLPAASAALVYLDNNGVAQDNSGGWSITGSRSGLIYADGSLSANAGTVFRGLVYAEGEVNFNGHAWFIGGVIVKGGSNKMNGGMTILYSENVIKDTISKIIGTTNTLAWRQY